jgi:hypothetical protein
MIDWLILLIGVGGMVSVLRGCMHGGWRWFNWAFTIALAYLSTIAVVWSIAALSP